jgi:hypothetical protein
MVLDGDGQRAPPPRRRPSRRVQPQGLGKNLYLELGVKEGDFMARLFGLRTPSADRVELLRPRPDPFPDRPIGKLRGMTEGRAVRRPVTIPIS